jgi:hypothetical protein
MGIDMIVEGILRIRQLACLRKPGCDCERWFLFCALVAGGKARVLIDCNLTLPVAMTL